jgi:hypothetical protein
MLWVAPNITVRSTREYPPQVACFDISGTVLRASGPVT